MHQVSLQVRDGTIFVVTFYSMLCVMICSYIFFIFDMHVVIAEIL